MFVIAAAIQESGSTGGGFLHSIPHDASAALVYVLMAGFVALIVIGSRKKRS
jgi:hypothetical protein